MIVTRRNVRCVSAGEYCVRNIYFKCKLALSEYESEIDSRHYLNINVELYFVYYYYLPVSGLMFNAIKTIVYILAQDYV